jgi:hypothetical protein
MGYVRAVMGVWAALGSAAYINTDTGVMRDTGTGVMRDTGTGVMGGTVLPEVAG